MTPQEAAEHSVHEKVRNDDVCMFASEEDLLIYDHFFRNGMKHQSEQDNQALSSALKEIAELHAKVKELQEDLEYNAKTAIETARERDELEDDNNDLEEKAKYYGDRTISFKISETLLNKEQVVAIIKLLNGYVKEHGYDAEKIIYERDLEDIESDLLSLKKMEPPMMGMSY